MWASIRARHHQDELADVLRLSALRLRQTQCPQRSRKRKCAALAHLRLTTVEDQPWGVREFPLVDEDGSLILGGRRCSCALAVAAAAVLASRFPRLMVRGTHTPSRFGALVRHRRTLRSDEDLTRASEFESARTVRSAGHGSRPLLGAARLMRSRLRLMRSRVRLWRTTLCAGSTSLQAGCGLSTPARPRSRRYSRPARFIAR